MTVLQAMNSHVVSVDVDDTLATAAQVMDENHLASVPVIHDEVVAGILTMKDVRAYTQDGGHDPANEFVGSVPLHRLEYEARDTDGIAAISFEATLEEALERMDELHVRSLAVHDVDFQIIGTTTVAEIERALKEAAPV